MKEKDKQGEVRYTYGSGMRRSKSIIGWGQASPRGLFRLHKVSCIFPTLPLATTLPATWGKQQQHQIDYIIQSPLYNWCLRCRLDFYLI